LERTSLYVSKFTSKALQDVRGLPKNVQNALRKKFEKQIHVDPRSCSEPLTGPLADFRSFHFGNYRVVYKVYEDLKAVAVVGVGEKDSDHQTQLYKKLENLAKSGKLAEAVLETIRLLSRP
jgi:mRNA-degrading endonuclease RelE of RelBE toxin-antitoxin system